MEEDLVGELARVVWERRGSFAGETSMRLAVSWVVSWVESSMSDGGCDRVAAY